MSGQIAAVLFDKDGTLFEFQATWGGWAADFLLGLAGGDAGLADQLATRIGLDRAARRFNASSLAVAGTSAEVIAALLPALPGMAPEDLAARMAESAARLDPVAAVPLRPLLAGLAARGIGLGVATNDDEAVARAQLARAGVERFFAFVAGADSGHGAKPAPGQCLAFAAALNLLPGAVAMVGDSSHDLIAARRAGMVPVAVLTGTATADDLAPLADVVLRDIGDLPGWLGHD